MLATTSAAMTRNWTSDRHSTPTSRPGAAGPQQGAQHRHARPQPEPAEPGGGPRPGPAVPMGRRGQEREGEDQPVHQVLLDHGGSACQQAGGEQQPTASVPAHGVERQRAARHHQGNTHDLGVDLVGPEQWVRRQCRRRPGRPGRPAPPREQPPGAAGRSHEQEDQAQPQQAGGDHPTQGVGQQEEQQDTGRSVHEQPAVQLRAARVPAAGHQEQSALVGERHVAHERDPQRPREEDGENYRGPRRGPQVTKPGLRRHSSKLRRHHERHMNARPPPFPDRSAPRVAR